MLDIHVRATTAEPNTGNIMDAPTSRGARKSVRLTDEVHKESSFSEHSEPQLI